MKIYGSRDSFYQWDVNQKITSTKLKEGDEVHFANDRSGEAFVVKAYKYNHIVVADVPNILLQQTNKILVYRYVTDGVSELTVCEKSFDVFARPKPTDYIYTETDCITVQDFVFKALEEAKENGDFNGADGMGILKITADEPGKLVITLENGESVVIDIPTVRGEDGKDGVNGKDGKTPEKGVDYFTEADISEMVQSVLSALPDNREVAY